ncbi:MAG: hypothetical protein EOR12_27095 [Mesorhizobium sp.]|uniref:hypothetical protein n=1 Tax=Mesorhizobium sp. TaxID=1871066 RepID=UPI000FE5C8BB|nr:hypothetical protein [Mesorhizobium sp.]RWP84900.1 MAG: hypothetical protein EOR12_27095 [Mesorhizobium sp.]
MKSYRARVKEVQNQDFPTREDLAGFEVVYPNGDVGPVDSLIVRYGQTLVEAMQDTYFGCSIRVKAA